MNLSVFQIELEDLTNKIFKGDLTPLVYELLKDTPYKEDLIIALGGEVKNKETKSIDEEQPFIPFDTLFDKGLEVR